ncbi:MAG: hypothetical protein IT202_05585 [Fimbriimonadaceae bacterium]|nr:hypothetical protein [Fimbriimonadaceae bacterium]
MSILQAEPRAEGPTTKQLRRMGITPMAIIEKNKGTVVLQAPERSILDALKGASALGQFKVQINGEKTPRSVILKSVDKDPVANRLLHVAVLEVSRTDVVIVEVPIHFVGTPAPVEQKEGTVLHPTTHLKVRGQIQNLPDSLEIDISGLEMNHSASVSDLTISDMLEVLTPLDATIATIAPIVVQVESEAEPTEEGAEPELVGGESEGESESGGEG